MRVVAAFILSVLLSASVLAHDWPQWRNGEMNGVSAEKNLPSVAHPAPTRPRSYTLSSMAVSDGQLFVRTSEGVGDRKSRDTSLIC